MVVCVPYHLDELLPAFDPGVPAGTRVVADLPAGGPWQRMAALYDQVAQVVAALIDDRVDGAGGGAVRGDAVAVPPPVVVSGDCTTSLGIVAGLQRAGRDPGVVWFDAHADCHTEATTTSGYLGGMPLALVLGIGTPTLPDALGLRPVPPARAVLVDARDTDPAEHELLDSTAVRRRAVRDLDVADLPDGDLYVHVDADVCDPREVPDLLFPAPGGPAVPEVLDAVRRVLGTGRVVAIGVGATWRHELPARPGHRELVRGLLPG